METALPSQSYHSLTFPGAAEELVGNLEIPDRPEITGGYADVYHGFWTNPQGERVEVAIKRLKALNPRSRQSGQDSLIRKAETRIKREVFFWSRTKHPNLHPFLGYRLQPQPQLVSPWCRHGDLGDYLRSNPSLSRYEKLLLVHQAGCGLRHLHSRSPPICHADIKPGNVLINDLGQAVLSDFGLSRAMSDLDVSSGFTTSETVKGTFAYMAGELSSGQKPSPESDVYAFGGLMLTVMSNQAPFHGLPQLVILRRILLNEPPKPEDHPGLPAQDPLWGLMRRCWDPRPSARPTIYEVQIKLRRDIGPGQRNSWSTSDLAPATDDGQMHQAPSSAQSLASAPNLALNDLGRGEPRPRYAAIDDGQMPQAPSSAQSPTSASNPGPSDLRWGLPLPRDAVSNSMFIVEFKAGRTDLFYCTNLALAESLSVGDHVIVEIDLGKDLGVVIQTRITRGDVETFLRPRQTAEQMTSPDRTFKDIIPKRISGKAAQEDVDLLPAKAQDEATALQLCQAKVQVRRLPIEVIVAEYQWDRQKLTFYFVSDRHWVDFRELVRDLFRLFKFKTRIWMARLGATPGSQS